MQTKYIYYIVGDSVRELIEKIQLCPLFLSLTEEQCHRFFDVFPPIVRNYEKDEAIVRRNEHFHKIGCILKGKVSVHQDTTYGTSHIITWLSESDTFAEVLMFFPSQPYPTSITASQPTQVLFVEPDQITKIMDDIKDIQHQLLLNITKLISQKAFILHTKVEILTIKSIQGKICYYLLQELEKHGNNKFEVRLNREQMASYLHVSRPSLSRELRNLQNINVIDYNGKSFEVIDRLQCERIASEE